MTPTTPAYPRFDRKFFTSDNDFSVIGGGAVGGKAAGLAAIRDTLASLPPTGVDERIRVGIPRLAVLGTDVFDEFLAGNRLDPEELATLPDQLIAHRVLRASLPVGVVGDLRALVEEARTPLAIRSSSRLEDDLQAPFAGIYATKMIPNLSPSPDRRFQHLTEAVKLVYASTFFRAARDYRRGAGHPDQAEKMAVAIQEVVGRRHGHRFYPDLSGVARSHNAYPTGRARPEDGVAHLALGLGKTIVDGDLTWFYAPPYPKLSPPFGSPADWLKHTQLHFWAVNMGPVTDHDPTRETEYLTRLHIAEAEPDGTLALAASTYDPAADRIVTGLSGAGPRLITFAPLLKLAPIPFNDCLRRLLAVCRERLGTEVEIEFALTLDPGRDTARLGFLQVRPMAVSGEPVDVPVADMTGPGVLLSAERVLGNGTVDDLTDVVYLKPGAFDTRHTRRMALDVATCNTNLRAAGRACLLIGFGRWGTTDEWAGVPVDWGQISAARVIVESAWPGLHTELSQGSHFFHNVTAFQVLYFSVTPDGPTPIDWAWLDRQPPERETEFVRHVRLTTPLRVRVDGRTGRGVIHR